MSTEVKPKAVSPLEDFLTTLDGMTKQFEMVLPEHVPVEKFKRIVRTAVQMDVKLIDADRHSLFGACMKAAQDGLLVDGREAALIVYNTNVGTKAAPRYVKMVQFMPMMPGILKKVRNSGELASIGAHVVYKSDEFKYWIDEDGEHLNHTPKFEGERGEITHAYAIAKTKDGGKYIEVMPRADIDQIRNVSRAKDSGPWKEWFGEMCKKSVLRRISKRLPMSTDLEEVIRRDDDLFDLEKDNAQDEPTPAETKPSRLGKIIDAQVPTPTPPPQAAKPAPAAAPKAAAPAAAEPNEDPNVDEELPI